MSARDSYHMYRNGDYTFSLKYCQHSNLTDSVTTLTWEIKPILKQAPVTFTVNKWLAGWKIVVAGTMKKSHISTSTTEKLWVQSCNYTIESKQGGARQSSWAASCYAVLYRRQQFIFPVYSVVPIVSSH